MDSMWLIGAIGVSCLLLWVWIKQKRKDALILAQYLAISGATRNDVLSDKGVQGEFAIYKSIQKLNLGGYVLANLYVPYKGAMSEIDLVWVHKTGVYVIESKNYSGKVYGSEHTLKWAQYLGGQKFLFYNPIKQNKTHMKALVAKGIPENQLRSVILFGANATLQKIEVSIMAPPILKLQALPLYMNKTIKNSEKIYTDKEVSVLANTLFKSYALASDATKAQHIERIQRKYGETA